MRWAGHVAHMERRDTCIWAKVERSEQERSLGRPERRW